MISKIEVADSHVVGGIPAARVVIGIAIVIAGLLAIASFFYAV